MVDNTPGQNGESTLLCPRCVSQMLPLQRFGVTIDQCTGCGGIFLDRGELETLVEAEGKFYAPPQQGAPAQQGYAPQYPPQQYPPQQYPQQGYPPRRGGFLGQLFGEGHHGYYDHHDRHRGGHH